MSDALENYLLLLAHDVIRNETDYVFLLDEMGDSQNRHELVIIDNGVIELGKAVPFEQVIEAANIACAGCIVMPDVLGDYPATKKAVVDTMGLIRDCDFPVMKVPQGKDISDLVLCIDWLKLVMPKHPDGDYWGVPRWITNKFGARGPIIEYINRVCDAPRIHLLGMSERWPDDVYCAHMPNVIGIDSANPIVCGLHHLHMRAQVETIHMPRGNFWNKVGITPTVLENITYVRETLA